MKHWFVLQVVVLLCVGSIWGADRDAVPVPRYALIEWQDGLVQCAGVILAGDDRRIDFESAYERYQEFWDESPVWVTERSCVYVPRGVFHVFFSSASPFDAKLPGLPAKYVHAVIYMTIMMTLERGVFWVPDALINDCQKLKNIGLYNSFFYGNIALLLGFYEVDEAVQYHAQYFYAYLLSLCQEEPLQRLEVLFFLCHEGFPGVSNLLKCSMVQVVREAMDRMDISTSDDFSDVDTD